MFTILGIDHLVLRISNLSRMLDFYLHLGCTLERERPELGLYQLRAGNALIDLITIDGPLGRTGGAPAETEGRNLDHFCLRIEPFDKAELESLLTAMNLSTGCIESRYGADGLGPSIYLKDPEGNTLELKGPPLHR
ncbi:lactoylglutathione lyase [Pokkaliibacter plantistimulans]|uniref:Lactoylglutathione lyase n=1 Tax=Pokkaliibacter plantistimulans TaxID=1635171 RepID=A0ABX5LRR5_9GAMM|nr:VOC family protein [Pokkaliibacter plantistimulans]PXF29335.1 lactoylglutathione lyase [Pokkaliibacter plantistimulans]